MAEFVLPQHANAIGTAFGGTLVAWIDLCGAMAAQRHCGCTAVTAAIDDLEFVAPIRVGDVVCLSARVNAAFKTSVEVEVLAQREDKTTLQRTLCVQALVTFVAIDATGKPVTVPPLLVEDPDDQRRAEEAAGRRRERLARRGAKS